MNASEGYAVFFFPQALEALGDAVKPYLTGQAEGPHIFCKEIDTAGAFTEPAREFLRSVPNKKLEKPFTWDELFAVLEELRAEAGEAS